MRIATAAIHTVDALADAHGAAVQPIYQSSTYHREHLEDDPVYMYARYGNPNRDALERTLAALEGADHGVCFASGMAAISAVLSLARTGEHVLIASDIYGGTFNIGKEVLPRRGVEVSFFDPLDPESVDAEARPNTRLLIYEAPTNPTLRVPDIAAVAAKARARGVLSVFDNTFATPMLTRPRDYGVDVVVHSTTKFIGGHSDVTGGAVLTNDPKIHGFVLQELKLSGGVPEPFASWLTLRGVKSLSARMRVHCENAQRVAEFLRGHPQIASVHYPGLPDHPGHELAARQMGGRFGGVVAFEVHGGRDGASRCAQRTRLFHIGASLGGVESLLSYPPLFSHAGMTEAERVQRGIMPGLLRASVGLEDAEDLIADLDQALTT